MQSTLRTSTARIATTSRSAMVPRSAARGQARFSSSDPAQDHSQKKTPPTARFNLAVAPLPIFVGAGLAAGLAFSIHHLFKDKDLRIDHAHQSLIDVKDSALEKALASTEQAPPPPEAHKEGDAPAPAPEGIKAYGQGSSGVVAK